MLNKRAVNSTRRTPRGSDAKVAQQNDKNGRASNRMGTRYGARDAGRAPEHFEPHDHVKHSHGSAKAHPVKGPRRKTKEQRIVSG